MAKVTLMKREPTHLQIAHRAFEIYVSRGGHRGHDVGDWFEAERQLRAELQPKKRAAKQFPDATVAVVSWQACRLAIPASFP